jgi:hypothetical protein
MLRSVEQRMGGRLISQVSHPEFLIGAPLDRIAFAPDSGFYVLRITAKA